MADVCEAFCLFRVFSGLPQLVFIRVHSWLIINDLVVAWPLQVICGFLYINK